MAPPPREGHAPAAKGHAPARPSGGSRPRSAEGLRGRAPRSLGRRSVHPRRHGDLGELLRCLLGGLGLPRGQGRCCSRPSPGRGRDRLSPRARKMAPGHREGQSDLSRRGGGDGLRWNGKAEGHPGRGRFGTRKANAPLAPGAGYRGASWRRCRAPATTCDLTLM